MRPIAATRVRQQRAEAGVVGLASQHVLPAPDVYRLIVKRARRHARLFPLSSIRPVGTIRHRLMFLEPFRHLRFPHFGWRISQSLHPHHLRTIVHSSDEQVPFSLWRRVPFYAPDASADIHLRAHERPGEVAGVEDEEGFVVAVRLGSGHRWRGRLRDGPTCLLRGCARRVDCSG